ncbi:MAG: hypothetical protein GC185_06840 [Alphaproteobacteria bacterium]|nr:hypothetical protein [Alphaproteobacteria bacterium]
MRFAALTTALLLFCAAVPSSSAQAAPRLTTAALMQQCNSHDDLDYGYCAGYVNAIADRMLKSAIGGFRACHHAHIRSQQYVDIFKDYAARFPATAGKDAGQTAAAAFARAFPCNPEGLSGE